MHMQLLTGLTKNVRNSCLQRFSSCYALFYWHATRAHIILANWTHARHDKLKKWGVQTASKDMHMQLLTKLTKGVQNSCLKKFLSCSAEFYWHTTGGTHYRRKIGHKQHTSNSKNEAFKLHPNTHTYDWYINECNSYGVMVSIWILGAHIPVATPSAFGHHAQNVKKNEKNVNFFYLKMSVKVNFYIGK